ncbi:hypothetical protein SAMN02745883_02164 [Caminicella sporogenes DSM 14501]|uniref:Uncharacterized protein n=1 Tax=Caminicella sporogenes DSM 14501 TaxID=1121266 RepID=A0A1M6SVW6_9FIRM|nr:hypothetical protein [Caminicella sporogenes]RKD21917.1 hypothetical protein BET04_06600 [Caminicella sporogenes]SHK48855.1 hypothetical protein SAMN02745883_02164 [Caminicella sporogenes DSM 14501]
MKRKFKVIKGGGNKKFIPNYKFIKAEATNTRLMGVIALRIYWETELGEKFVQFFHLDCEEYGIDGYESLLNASAEDVEIITMKMMGGLGGKLVEINEREAIYLIKSIYEINLKNNEMLPGNTVEYEHLLNCDIKLNKEEEENLWNKICEKIKDEVQLVNYYIMRCMGTDTPAQKFLSMDFDFEKFQPTTRPSTLIKNVVDFSHEEDGIKFYIAESVIDMAKGYQLIISEIGIVKTEKGLKVAFAQVRNRMRISPVEAAFKLRKPEYILIYSLKNFIDIIEIFDKDKRGAMQNIYEAGFLYTEFNPHNEHVKDSVYYLNGDIFAVYFVTTGNQLAVGTFVKENVSKIKRYFKSKKFSDLLEFEVEFKLDSPLLYEFVHSGLNNFFEFINRK